ncbi:hypothetical protein MTO96_051202, partial [Rhipicephalus appendiculatus]
AVGNSQGNNRSYVIVLQDPPTILRSRLPTGNVRDPVKDRERSLLPLPPRPGQAFNNPVYLLLGDHWERQRMPLPPTAPGGSPLQCHHVIQSLKWHLHPGIGLTHLVDQFRYMPLNHFLQSLRVE